MYTKEEINRAVDVDIVDYCHHNGIDLKQDSERYYRLLEHDSCVIDRRKNAFFWNSRNVGGNSINFVQELEGINFKIAMAKLIEGKTTYESTDQVEYVSEPYEYNPDREVQQFDKARYYLVNERKIDPEIVDHFYEKGLIKQDKNNNVLFLWKDYENIMGCSEQGTVKTDKYKRGSWKSVQKNSTENYGFNVTYGEPKKLKFFESSIDLMSYATLNKSNLEDTQLVSMEGLKHNTVFNYIVKAGNYLNDSPDSISICVDNDKAGKTFAERFTHFEVKKKDGQKYDLAIDVPTEPGAKDWNEQLKQLAKKDELEKKQRFQKYRGLER